MILVSFSFFLRLSECSLCKPITVGYTLMFHNYSTWRGKSLFLEDLYVKPEYRRRGIGRRLFRHAGQFAVQKECCRLDFHVLKWNPARAFYESLGAIDLTTTEEWHFYRLNSDALNGLFSEIA